MKILITGGLGWTAQAIITELSAHDLILFDLPGTEGDAQGAAVVYGSVADDDAVRAVMSGVDTVVHLAVLTGSDHYQQPESAFRTNVLGTYNVLEAARRSGVQRVALMSEAAVHVPGPTNQIVAADTPLQTSSGDDHLYDLTKRLQETIAHDYAQTYGLPVVVLRPGHIVDGRAGVDPRGRPLAEVTYLRGGWVCRYDVARAVAQAVIYDADPYAVFHIIGSESARQRFAVTLTEQALSFTIDERFTAYD